MKKKLFVLLALAFVLSFVFVSCEADKITIDQSNVQPLYETYECNPDDDLSQEEIVSADQLCKDIEDFASFLTSNVDTNDVVLQSSEKDGTAQTVTKTILKIGGSLIGKIQGVPFLSSIYQYASNFIESLFDVDYSSRASQMDKISKDVQGIHKTLERLETQMTQQKFYDEFSRMSNLMVSIEKSASPLYKSIVRDAKSQKFEKDEDAINWINRKFKANGVDPETLMMNTRSALVGMQPSINTGHNYFQLMDFIVRKSVAWEEQGFAIREALRASDNLALMEAVLALNLYYTINYGEDALYNLEELNEMYKAYLTLQENNMIDYTDFNNGFAVCCIDGAYIKFNKNDNDLEEKSLINIYKQMTDANLYHLYSASGYSKNMGWKSTTVPKSYISSIGLDSGYGKNYFYHFNISLAESGSKDFKYNEELRNYGGYAGYMSEREKDIVNTARRVNMKSIANRPYLKQSEILAITNYYKAMDSENKKSASNPNIINNHFLYAMVDGNVFTEAQVSEWFKLKTSVDEKYGASNISASLVLLYDEGQPFYEWNAYFKNDKIWFSMYRTEDDRWFEEYTPGIETGDRQNLIMTRSTLKKSDGQHYLFESGLVGGGMHYYYHPAMTFARYEIKGDLK